MKRVLIICALAFTLGGASVFAFLTYRNDTAQKYVKTNVVRDTIIEFQAAAPIIIERVKSKIVYKSDTIYTTPAFISRIDTIIQRDTIYMQYNFPQHTMSLMIRKEPVSAEIRTITITEIQMKDRPWWEASLYVAGGCGLGLLVGFALGQ